MAIAINGSGTVTGISVGGLPDGIVDTDMLAADAVTSPKIGSKTFVSYAMLGDRKAADADGGTFTSGAHRTRDLTHIEFDPDSIVSLSSNQFTLQAGTYLIKWKAPGWKVDHHCTRLKNATDGTSNGEGTSGYSASGATMNDYSSGTRRITIGGAKAFEIVHRCSTSASGNGFGAWASPNGNYSWYTIVEIYKEA